MVQDENATVTTAIFEDETQLSQSRKDDVNTVQVRLCNCAAADPYYTDNENEELVFCPVTYSHCAIPSSEQEQNSHDNNISYTLPPVGCSNQSKEHTLADRTWRLIIVSYSILILGLVGTNKGWHAMNYCLNFCLPQNRHNDSIVNHLLRRNRYLATQQILNYLRDYIDELGEDYLPEYNNTGGRTNRRRRRNNDNGIDEQETTNDTPPPPPNCLELKTRIYKRTRAASVADSSASSTAATTTISSSPSCSSFISDEEKQQNSVVGSDAGYSSSSSNDNNISDCCSASNGDSVVAGEDDDHTCTICFAELVSGDRVGALSCNHIFHVECLKEWLSCRNVCPLCLQENVATLTYHPHEHCTDDENDPSPSSLSSPANSILPEPPLLPPQEEEEQQQESSPETEAEGATAATEASGIISAMTDISEREDVDSELSSNDEGNSTAT